jgi:hypothetical protein
VEQAQRELNHDFSAGLAMDGIIGPATWNGLDASVAEGGCGVP